MMIIDDDSGWVARCERARRWIEAGQDLRGYPALSAEQETDTPLVAAPPEKVEKKSRTAAPTDG